MKKRTQGMNWIRKEKRLAIYLRDGLACPYCGDTVENGAKLSLDHLTPYSQGGSNSETNLITCCCRCNSARQDRPVHDFVEKVAGYINEDAMIIMAYIEKQTKTPLKSFRKEAKEIMARRGTWERCLS